MRAHLGEEVPPFRLVSAEEPRYVETVEQGREVVEQVLADTGRVSGVVAPEETDLTPGVAKRTAKQEKIEGLRQELREKLDRERSVTPRLKGTGK